MSKRKLHAKQVFHEPVNETLANTPPFVLQNSEENAFGEQGMPMKNYTTTPSNPTTPRHDHWSSLPLFSYYRYSVTTRLHQDDCTS